MDERPLESRSDEELLTAVRELWERVDPPPGDLADGVLARIAAEDLEFELLTLVERDDALSGVRATAVQERDEVGTWSLEYVGPDVRVFIRITHVEGRHRIDGWVVPTRPLTVRLTAEEPRSLPQQVSVDEHGRFAFPDAPSGAARMTFVEEPRTTHRPHVTPPFWI